MKLVGKVPVEPLDDERLTNIERNLVVHVSEMSQRPLRAPSRMLAFAGVALAVVAAGFFGWKLRGNGTPAELGPKSEQFVMKDGALELGDAQITGKDFAVTRTKDRVEVVMREPGKLDLHVEHKPGRLFVVHAGNVDIEDVGTRFSVDYDGKNVDVSVTEGEVTVKHGSAEESIKAGEAWDLEIGKISIAALAAKQAAALVAQAQVPTPNTVVGAAGTGSGAVRSGSNATSNSGSNATSNSGSNAGAGSGSGRPRKIGGPDAKKALEKWPDEPQVAATAKDPKEAVKEYLGKTQALPQPQTLAQLQDKADLLQSIAVMHIRAKNYAGAIRALDGVLHERRASDWPAYTSALWLDVRAKCLLARTRGPTFDDACRVAAEKYIVKIPTGPQSGIVQQVLNEI